MTQLLIRLRIVGSTGASVALASGPGANEATFTVTNTDLGSAQSTYTDFACTNNSGAAGGTCSATSNGQALNLVGGDSCDLSVDPVSNTITIDNTIDKVYASVVGDDGISLEASGTVDQLDILCGNGIRTEGTAAPGGNELTIINEGITSITGNTGIAAITDASGGCTLTNSGVTSAVAGSGISVSGATGAVTITADVLRDDATTPASGTATLAAGVSKDFTHTIAEQYVQVRVIALAVSGGISIGDDITSDCKINLAGVGAYTVTSGTYSGNVKIVVLG